MICNVWRIILPLTAADKRRAFPPINRTGVQEWFGGENVLVQIVLKIGLSVEVRKRLEEMNTRSAVALTRNAPN